MPFKTGDRVRIIPHREKIDDEHFKERYAVVTDPHVPTDMRRIDGSAVGFYVAVEPEIRTPKTVPELFHEASLALANETVQA